VRNGKGLSKGFLANSTTTLREDSQLSSISESEGKESGMEFSRQHVVDLLRGAGFRDAANEALVELPDPVDLEDVASWAEKHGITRDVLISSMGGSP
jgi:hypothetical protein